MYVLQISPSSGQNCGIALFAEDLAREMTSVGVAMSTVCKAHDAARSQRPDLVLAHHHEDLLSEKEILDLRRRFDCPLILFTHSAETAGVLAAGDAVVTMNAHAVSSPGLPRLTIAHPAWTPTALSSRPVLRSQLCLPPETPTVGTCGFLKFDRQLDEIASALIPPAIDLGWRIQILTSPWRMDSPGLLDRLGALRDTVPQHLTVRHGYLPHEALNRYLQSCELLWCWTREPSSAYASGVASCLYASGSRMVVADKVQHEHVLTLPNVVRAPTRLDLFVEAVAAEMTVPSPPRHDPDPISWRHQVHRLRSFLAAAEARSLWRRSGWT